MPFMEFNLTESFQQFCQTVNGIINGVTQQNNQGEITLRITGDKMVSILCHGESCTNHNNSYTKELVIRWINSLASQLSCCFSQEYNANNYSATLHESSFDYSAFAIGLVGTFALCTSLYLFLKALCKNSNHNQTLERVRAKGNIYTLPKEERNRQTVGIIPRTSEERVEILSENTEEENQGEEHIYENVAISTNMETLQSTTVLPQSEVTRL
ncbi:hypothetical protein K6025_05290 [Ehrlichia sp. JZT12]